MEIAEGYSIRGAKQILEAKGALVPSLELAKQCNGDPAKNHVLKAELGFIDPTHINLGPNENRPHFDAYSLKWKVGVEHEMREQMNVRSHLLFTEIAYQKKMIEVAVYILPMTGKAKFSRTIRELTEYGIFTKYFPITVPLYLIGIKK